MHNKYQMIECQPRLLFFFAFSDLVQVPKNILTGGDTPTKWDKDSLTDVFIFKSDLADSFVIPEFGLGGRWLEIKDFLSTWTNEARGPFPQTKLPTLSSNLPNDYDIQKIQDILNNSIPVKNMDQSEFENVMQSFRLSLKHFKKHIFEQMDAHIHQVSESTKPEILFPIRFIGKKQTCLKLIGPFALICQLFSFNLIPIIHT